MGFGGFAVWFKGRAVVVGGLQLVLRSECEIVLEAVQRESFRSDCAFVFLTNLA